MLYAKENSIFIKNTEVSLVQSINDTLGIYKGVYKIKENDKYFLSIGYKIGDIVFCEHTCLHSEFTEFRPFNSTTSKYHEILIAVGYLNTITFIEYLYRNNIDDYCYFNDVCDDTLDKSFFSNEHYEKLQSGLYKCTLELKFTSHNTCHGTHYDEDLKIVAILPINLNDKL